MARSTSDRIQRDCRGRKIGIRVAVVMLGIVIGTVFFAYAAFAGSVPNTIANDASMRQVLFVFRHGDRTPTETYVKDPYRDYNWPGGWGALTKTGMLQMYKVGQWIRKEYGSIIGSVYDSKRALVQSSYADRCIMSAGSLLAGLYPPSPDEMFLPGLAWRPVPVHSTPRHLDQVIVVKVPCPRLEEALKEAYRNESIKSGPRLSKYYEQLSAHTGQTIATITDVEFLYNTLEIEEQHGLKLPEWTKNFYNEEMREISAKSLAIFTSNELQRRLRGGPLLKQIMEHMNGVENGSNEKKAYLYSAHDITLVNLLRTMGFTNEYLKPDYGATLIFELHTFQPGNDLEVKVLYLNSTETVAAHPMTIPNCATPCLLSNLRDLWKNVIPDNWNDECSL